MYTSIRRYKIGAGSMDELMRIVNEGAVPIIRDVPCGGRHHRFYQRL
jgi:hypothetical protein